MVACVVPSGEIFFCHMRVVSAAPPAVRAAVGTHPLGVQPIGNALLDDGPPRRPVELGAFRVFDDEFLLQLLTEYVDAKSVARLGATSRTFYALASAPQIWRDHYTACLLYTSDAADE